MDDFVPDDFAADDFVPEQVVPKKGRLRRIGEAVVASPALPIAGGIVGGIAGGGLASIPLAGLGAAGGESYRQIAARGLGVEAPPTSIEALKGIGSEALSAAAGQGLGLGAAKTIAGAGRLLAPIGRKTVDALSAATGVQKAGFQSIVEKPSRIVTATAGKIKKVGKQIGEVVDSAIQKDMTPKEAAVSLVERAFRTPAANRNVAKKVALKFAAGESVDDSEVALANRAINVAIKNTTDDGTRALLQQQKQVFQDYLGKNLPTLKALNTEFSKLKAANAFRSLGRLNKSGETSRLGLMYLTTTAKNPGAFLTMPALIGPAVAGAAAAGHAVTRPALMGTAGQALTRIEKRKKK